MWNAVAVRGLEQDDGVLRGAFERLLVAVGKGGTTTRTPTWKPLRARTCVSEPSASL
jgi:hypothetical protein